MDSTIEIDACNFCTSMIKLNINLLANSDSSDYTQKKKALINDIRNKHSYLSAMSDYELQKYLSSVYVEKIDKDKYGKNNMAVGEI